MEIACIRHQYFCCKGNALSKRHLGCLVRGHLLSAVRIKLSSRLVTESPPVVECTAINKQEFIDIGSVFEYSWIKEFGNQSVSADKACNIPGYWRFVRI